jgi:hypothetical protein
MSNNSYKNIQNDGYKLIKISYVDEDNQIRYMDQLVPNYFNSQGQILLNQRNDFNNLYNSEQRRISANNSNNNSRNISSKLLGNNLQNNLSNKNSRFSNNEIPSIIDEEYINNRIRKAEIININNDFNNQSQNENVDFNNQNTINNNINDNTTIRKWYSFRYPSLSLRCPKIKFPRISIPSCKNNLI